MRGTATDYKGNNMLRPVILFGLYLCALGAYVAAYASVPGV